MEKKYNELSFEEISEYVKCWSWQELNWGLQNNLLANKDIIKYAKQILDDQMKEFDMVIELSIADNDEDISWYLDILINSEVMQDECYIKDKWRYVIIQYLYNNRIKYETVYDNIELIYADFDYPEDMAGFIRYMPANGGRSIEDSWEKYLSEAKRRFHLDLLVN